MSNLNLTLSDNFPYPSEVFFADEEVPRDYSERFNFSTKLRDTISITTSAINQRVIHVLSAALNMEGEISESVNRISMQSKISPPNPMPMQISPLYPSSSYHPM